MENRLEDSYEAETPKRSRSLDLKTLYKSSISKESETKSLKRKIRSQSIENVNRNASKKSRKAVQLYSFKDVDRKRRKSLKAVYNRSLSSVSNDSESSKKLGLSQKLKKSPNFNGVSLCLDDTVNRIPRRKRGFVGRNKFEVGQVLNPEGGLRGEAGLVNLTGQQSVEDSGSQVDFTKDKLKKAANDLNVDRSGELSSTKLLKEEDGVDGHLGANDCNSSLRELLKNGGIRKGRAKDGKNVEKGHESMVEGSINSSVAKYALPENDEENLEENAARMLSSRFDPTWTGFSSNVKASASRPINRSHSGKNHDVQESNTLSGSESASVDNAGRLLRLRKNHKGKASSKKRKRRHYYDISSGDWDAYWVLNRRIKVFWPLDESWYIGLVNDYDEKSKLHHVKYDDRDEEWINLQHEKFKLLLLPSEVPGNHEKKRSRIREKHSGEGRENLKLSKEKGSRNLTRKLDMCNGTYMDSEPIISWLARSSLQIKKKKTFVPSIASSGSSLLFDKSVGGLGCLDEISVRKAKVKLSSSSGLLDRATEGGSDISVSGCLNDLKESKPPIVYFRRRFHRSGKALSHATGRNFVSGTVPETVGSATSIVQGFLDFDEQDSFHGRLDPDNDLWLSDDVGNIVLNISLLHSRRFRFQLSFPLLSVPNNTFAAENFWLVRTKILRHCGMLMTVWPRVHLEILFVDNIVGLRFLWFEGCLKQAISFVVQVLLIFCGSNKQAKFAELQLPVTSIRFKVSSTKDIRKHIVFAFYSFQKVKKTKWMLLDSQLKGHCLITKQLPLSECTTDSIKALQYPAKQLLKSPSCGDILSLEGTRSRRFTQGVSPLGLSRESSYLEVSQFSSDRRHNNLPHFAFAFGAAPTFFISLHLRLLIERTLSHAKSFGHNLIERPEISGSLVVDESSHVVSLSKGFEGSSKNYLMASLKGATLDGYLTFANSGSETVTLSGCSNRSLTEYSQKLQNCDLDVGHSSAVSNGPEEPRCNPVVPLLEYQGYHLKLDQRASLTTSSVGDDRTGKESTFVDGESPCTQQLPDLTQNMNGGVILSPNPYPTAPRSTWHRSRTISSSAGFFSNQWSVRKADFSNHFCSGLKKRRTQVSYSLPFGDLDFSSKNKGHNQKGLSHKRIRRTSEKRLSEAYGGSKRNLDLLSCDANVLITLGDRGWRECGAQIVLELFDHNEWKLAVKTSGSTRYSYKAHQVLLPGTTNRYTHAMMWKGGKDWTLEFPDRSQWALFKQMHEECYNRNFRAASIKNIPIPGVCLVDDYNDNGMEASVFRSSSKYIRQVENDVEMALDPSRVLYDMDSDDERWIWRVCNSSKAESSTAFEISEEMFEKTMDMFEKTVYTQERDQFGSDEIEELLAGVGPIELIKSIYDYWRQKRQRKGMPLIRHLQPPLWEKHQQQVKEWELAISKANSIAIHPGGCTERVPSIEKPPMFAFCLKPRGLELPNKLSKQRSQKKISVSGKTNAALGDHDGCYSFGRRSNWFACGDEKFIYTEHRYESFDESPLSQGSPRSFTPRDANSTRYSSMSSNGFSRNYYHKLQRNRSKKFGTYFSSNRIQMMASSNHRPMGKRNDFHHRNMGFSDWSGQQHEYMDGPQWYFPEYCGSYDVDELRNSYDLDELQLRDASVAAQTALKVARLKREKAQKLLYRADLAIHKAAVALMTAGAMKVSSEHKIGDINDGR